MTQRGAFIVVEGLDGAGKTSNVRNIQSYFSGSDVPHFIASEYADTKFTSLIRKTLNEQDPQLDPITETMLFYASRIEHTQNIIKPYLESGYHVICDRYYPSTLAYQGIRTDAVHAVHELARSRLQEPDLVLFYDIPVEVYEERVLSRGKGLDAIEGRGREYFLEVRANFHKLAENDSRFIKLDASRPLDEVFTDTIQKLNDFLRNFNEGHIQP